MFRIFSGLIIIVVLYVLTVFLAPEVADTYGKKSWNDSIRSLKSFSDRLPTESPAGLLEGIQGEISTLQDTTKGYIQSGSQLLDETQKTYETTRQVIGEKVEQGKAVIESGKQTYSDIEQAKQSLDATKKAIQDLATMSGASRESGR